MPYRTTSGLDLPGDSSLIWRYLDFWKFEALIQQRGLFFVRSDRFSDPWDSALPPKWIAKMQEYMCDRDNGGSYTEAEWYEEREIPTNPIQCWNCDHDENERMWNEYTTDNCSLVIRSSVGRFKRCFESTGFDVRIGLINYGYHDELDDPKFAFGYWGDNHPILVNPWYVPRFLKQTRFAHENELRATIHVGQQYQPIDTGYNLEIGNDGINTLIESIRLHPSSNRELYDRVDSLLNSNGLEATVEQSVIPRKTDE